MAGGGSITMACAYKPALSTKKNVFMEIYMKKTNWQKMTSVVTGFAGVTDDAILPPAGVKQRSAKEHLICNQFTRARAKYDLREMDLILLAKTVKMEAYIRAT